MSNLTLAEEVSHFPTVSKAQKQKKYEKWNQMSMHKWVAEYDDEKEKN